MSLLIHLGAGSALGTGFPACLTAEVPDPGTPSCELAGEGGKRPATLACHPMKGKLVWGRPWVTDAGGDDAKTMLRVRAMDAYAI